MNAALQAYAATARTGLTGRALEAAVLTRCATDLQRASASLSADDPDAHFALIQALERNRQAWRIFAMQARDDDSPLPAEIRRNLLVTATFVFARTADICETTDLSTLGPLVRPLVECNRLLAAGLEGRQA